MLVFDNSTNIYTIGISIEIVRGGGISVGYY